MNWVDIIVMAILIISGILAFSVGFIKEILGLLAWIIAVVVAIYAAPLVLPMVGSFITNDLAAQLIAWGGVFFITLIIALIISYAIGNSLVTGSPSIIDRWFGLLFGLVRGVVIVCLLYMLTLWIFPAQEDRAFLEHSFTKPYLDKGVEVIRSFIPTDQPNSL